MKVKRLFSLSVLSLIILTGCGVNNAGSSSQEDDKQHLNITNANLIASITDNEKYLNPDLIYDLDVLDENDSIGVIITLDDSGIFDSYQANARGYSSLGAYVKSNYGVSESNQMIKNQEAVIKTLKSAGLIDYVNHSYTTLINGFSAETTYGDLEKLEASGLVKNVTISEVYAKPQATTTTTEGAVENVVDVYDTGIFNSSNVEYDGSNTAVAILDSGFDVHHSVFQKMPSETMITKSYVNSVLGEMKASGYRNGLIVEDVYLNAKIPFAYDYADKDPDVAPYDSNHGTHVAGIIGGSDEVITGVAVNTQLVLMKVFGDINNGAKTEDILAALEDAVTLGVDAINLSLGSSCGFSRSDDNTYINDVYAKIEEAGISMVVAASNDYNSAYGGEESNTNKVTNPDSASVGSPGTYTTAMSVASISGVKSKYITTDSGYVFFFNEANTAGVEPYNFYEMLYERLEASGRHIEDGEDIVVEYVTVPGVGKKVNYANIDVKGKVALVKRGETNFNEKAQMAYEAGAIACIIYNNIGGDVLMSAGNDLKIPLCSISKDDGEYLAANKTGTLVLNNQNQAGPFMSDFSSWGPNPDLSLKPEITAHGGTIKSAVPGGGYDELSGTSMACPNMTGVIILVRQYLKDKYPDLTQREMLQLTNQLLMSSTTIAMDKAGNPYSPRKQGSGLANLMAALNTQAYITVDGTDKTKIELGDDKEETGVYNLEFTLHNLSNAPLTYTLDDYTMTESVSTANKEFVAEKAYMLNPTTQVLITGNGTLNGSDVTVDANGSVTVKYTIKLTNEDKRYIRSSFPNGMYVEGYATLASKNSDAIDLSVPFLAFFGDWTVAPLFDKTYYEVESEKYDSSIDEEDKLKADYYATTPLGTYYYSYIIPIGAYVYEMDETMYDPIPASEEHAAIGYQLETINGITAVYAGLLRNAKEMYTTITNKATGEVVYDHLKYDQIKAHYSGGQIPSYDLLYANIKELNLENNVQYTFKMEAKLDYGDGGVNTNLNNTFEFDFYVDYETPLLTDAQFYSKYDRAEKENRYYVDAYVYDNHYAQSIRPFVLVNGEAVSLSEYPTPIYSEKGGITKVTLEITDYMDLLKNGSTLDGGTITNGLGLAVDDYALNTNYYYISLPGTDTTSIKFVNEKGNQVTDYGLRVGEQLDLTAMIQSGDKSLEGLTQEEISEYLGKLEWKSSNEKVARVYEGVVEGLSEGRAVISGKYRNNDGTDSTASITIRVRGSAQTDDNGDVIFSNDVKLENIEFTYYDTLKAFENGPENSEIGETGDRNFLIEKGYISFYPSEKVQLGYQITPWNLDPSRYELEWASTNEKVATVDQNGVVTAEKEGSANITLRIKVDGKQSSLMARARVVVKSEFVIEGRTLTAYKGKGGDVVIPDDEGIMYIGSYAFSLYTTDYTVELPEDNQDAGKTAIGNNTVTSVVIPYDVSEVQNYAFYNCISLEKVTFLKKNAERDSDTCKILRDGVFEGCTKLTTLETRLAEDNSLQPLRIEMIGRRCFANCTSLKTLDFTHVYALGMQAFLGCTSLETVDLTGVRNAGAEVFKDCSNLKEVINGEFTKFSERMFMNSGLETIEIYADRIPAQTFINCDRLTKVEIKRDELLYVGANAFENCDLLASVAFSGSCEYIFERAFANNPMLQTVTLPNSKVEISAYAFSDCENLAKVIFQADTYITKNDGSIFNNCSSLATFEVNSGNQEYIFDGTLLLNNGGYTVFFATPSYNYGDYTIPAGIKHIGEGAFSGINSLTSLILTDELITIGKYAFKDCSNLAAITLPTQEISIDNGAFANCSNLSVINNLEYLSQINDEVFMGSAITALVLGDAVMIGKDAFANSAKLTEVTVGNDVVIGEGAFRNNNALTTVNFGDEVTVNSYAFANCSVLANIDLSKIVGKLGGYAFANDKALVTANLINVTEIGEGAFINCYKISELTFGAIEAIGAYAFTTDTRTISTANLVTNIVLPDSLKAIGMYAFARNNNLVAVEIGNGLAQLGAYAFANNNKLVSFTTTSTDVQIVGDGAFSEDIKLKTLTLNGVEEVGANAFYNCQELTAFDFSNVQKIGASAFAQCYSLVEAVMPVVEKVEDRAFETAVKLNNVKMPVVVEIGKWAFSGIAVTEITLPETLVKVKTAAFYNNGAQTEFNYYDGSNYQQTAVINQYLEIEDGVLYTKLANGKYLLASYPTGKQAQEYEVKNNVVRIDYRAASNNLYLEKVILPETLELIGNLAFLGCTSLKTVEFKSTTAPTFEGTYELDDALTGASAEILTILNKFYAYGSTSVITVDGNDYLVQYHLFYGQFVDWIGAMSTKLQIIVPKNKNLVGYDSTLYSCYFDLENMTKSDYTALDSTSIDFLKKMALVPEVVNLNDKEVIENAKTAYNLVKQDLTDFGYTAEEVKAMEDRLASAEAQYKALMTERINKVYEILIEDMENLGSKFTFDKISDFIDIIERLNLVSKEDKKYLNTENVDKFQEEYQTYFNELREEIATITQVSTLSTSNVNKVGLVVATTILGLGGLSGAVFFIFRKRWFMI